jgi:hypothetical protein
MKWISPKIENFVGQNIKKTEQIWLRKKDKEICLKSNKTIFERLEFLYYQIVSEKGYLRTSQENSYFIQEILLQRDKLWADFFEKRNERKIKWISTWEFLEYLWEIFETIIDLEWWNKFWLIRKRIKIGLKLEKGREWKLMLEKGGVLVRL